MLPSTLAGNAGAPEHTEGRAIRALVVDLGSPAAAAVARTRNGKKRLFEAVGGRAAPPSI
jgi:hypothetical protein